jgi:hypothetical protein
MIIKKDFDRSVERLAKYAYSNGCKLTKTNCHASKKFLDTFWKKTKIRIVDEMPKKYVKKFGHNVYGVFDCATNYKSADIYFNKTALMNIKKDADAAIWSVISHEIAHMFDTIIRGYTTHDLHFIYVWVEIAEHTINISETVKFYKKEID